MAALQNAVALQSKTAPFSPPKTLSRYPLSLSFSSTFNPIKLPSLTFNPSKSRGGAASTKMTDTAASRYATALADVANSNGALESTSADVEKVNIIFSDPSVFDFFGNPIIDVEKKRGVLGEIVKSSALQPHTANFLNILIDMKRIELIKDIVKEFEVVYNKLTNTELAVVTSVVNLESQHLAQIAKGVQRLTGAKNVRIKTEIDPSLVAGFTIRYGNGGSKLVDMSVKKQLDEIAAQLDLGDVTLAI